MRPDRPCVPPSTSRPPAPEMEPAKIEPAAVIARVLSPSSTEPEPARDRISGRPVIPADSLTRSELVPQQIPSPPLRLAMRGSRSCGVWVSTTQASAGEAEQGVPTEGPPRAGPSSR